MNWIRNALIGGIFIVVFTLFIRWNEFQEERAIATENQTAIAAQQQSSDDIDETPQLSEATDDLPTAPKEGGDAEGEVIEPQPSSSLITVSTDTLDITIDLVGGDIVKVSLPKHLAKLEEGQSGFVLLQQNARQTYIAESDLIGQNGTHTSAGRKRFTAGSTHYQLEENDDVLNVDLQLQHQGAQITKRFHFERGRYTVGVDYLIANHSDQPWKAAMYGRIKRDDYRPKAGGMFQLNPYLGAATTTEESNYEKHTFEDIREKSIQFERNGGWVAMVQHYFVSAWVPSAEVRNTFSLTRSKNGQYYYLGFKTPLYSIAPGETATLSAQFYAGPKIIKNLEKLAPHLDLTIDFGVLWFIAKPLFHGLDVIHGFVGNWGFAIILLTFVIKLIFFYPSAISYRSMAKMRKLMPMMQELKERYGDDRQRMGLETMKLYKKEGVNPLGGCLPMLMQMPVFMALYWMIMESVELRHSPFILWVEDLSVKDPYFVLPLIMGVLMYVQQKLNPPPQDPTQAKILQWMPVGFTFILMFLPAALTLYMAVNSALSFVQQYLITKQIESSSS